MLEADIMQSGHMDPIKYLVRLWLALMMFNVHAYLAIFDDLCPRYICDLAPFDIHNLCYTRC